ncbi:uncharacterized protein LOC143196693 [Rhynchophorus ferrugineus]|uniref:uncharacterized protein LOC143196693 n=1 Tax=Rhynchophorus ferrugineus TaxID=354439 RepID=UPI003FCD4391
MATTKERISGLRMILHNYYNTEVHMVDEELSILEKPTCIELTAQFRKGGQSNLETLACFVKLCEFDTGITINIDQLTGFKKEVDFYRFVIPALTKYQKRQKIASGSHYYYLFPKCIGATVSILCDREVPDETGALVLENIKEMGYRVPDENLDMKSCKLVLSQMARMHAAPLAMKLVSLEEYKAQVVPYLLNTCYRKTPYRHFDARTLTADVLQMYDLSDSISSTDAVIEYSKSITDLNIIEDDTWFTLCHSDFTIRNLMMTYDLRGNPQGCKIIDWKCYSYSHCCDDLLLFLFTSVEIPILIECYSSLLDYYYTQLIYQLKKYRVGKKIGPYTKARFLGEVHMQGQKLLAQIVQALAYITCEGYKENGEPILGPLFRTRLISVIVMMKHLSWV